MGTKPRHQVSFSLPNADADEEESTYLSKATLELIEKATQSGTDEESSYSADRLNSNDFFNAPEVDLTPPKARVKRLSLEKQRSRHSSSEEKDAKKQQKIIRDLQKTVIPRSSSLDFSVTPGLKMRPSKEESKLRNKTRSLERDKKPSQARSPVLDMSNSLTLSSLTNGPDSTITDSSTTDPADVGFDQVCVGDGEASAGDATTSGSGKDVDVADRKVFHRWYMLGMQLGRRAYKEREEKGRNIHLQRQFSDIIYNGRDKMNHESLFMALQAYRKALEKQECMELIFQMRDKVPDKVQDILDYVFEPEVEAKTTAATIKGLMVNPFTISDEYLESIEDAIDSVSEALEGFDMVQSLFPTSKSMRREYESCCNKQFQRRISTLNMWLNNAHGLIAALRTVSRTLEVKRMPNVRWPYFETLAESRGDIIYINPATPSSNTSSSTPSSPTDGLADSLKQRLVVATNTKRVKFESGSPVSPSSSQPLGASAANMQGIDVAPSNSQRTAVKSNNRANASPGANRKVITSPYGSISPGSSQLSNVSEESVESDASERSDMESRNLSVGSSSQLNLSVTSPTVMYRHVVDRLLRKSSLLELTTTKSPLVVTNLLKARYSIIKMELSPRKEGDELLPPIVKNPDVLPLSAHYDIIALHESIEHKESQDDEFVSFYEEFNTMNLPSLIPLYIFISRLPLDLTHESIRLRLEQQIESPSLPIIKQVVHEFSEAAKVAVSVKQAYQYVMTPVSKKYDINADMFDRSLENFNCDLNKVMESYFDYVEYGKDLLQREASPIVLRNFLEENWSYCKNICPFIPGGVAEAGKRFCGMASLLFLSLNCELTQQLDEALFNYDPSLDVPSSPISDYDSDPASQDSDSMCRQADYRQMLMQTCREIKSLFTKMKVKNSKALGFAKTLRKDLEIASEFKVMVTFPELMKILEDTGHTKVKLPIMSNIMLFVPNSIKDDRKCIKRLLDVTCGREEAIVDDTDPLASSDGCLWNGYVLLVDRVDKKFVWKGEIIHVEPKMETTICLSHFGVTGVFLVVAHSSHLNRQREDFHKVLDQAVKLRNEQTTCHLAIAEAWSELRSHAFDLASEVKKAIEHVETQLDSTDLSNLDSNTDVRNVKGAYKETLHQCYAFGFEFLQEFNKLNTNCTQLRDKKNSLLLAFARQWMRFVMTKCEKGKGTRPRWANPGFDFLGLVLEPSITKSIDEEEFQNLKRSVTEAVSHIIGEATVNKNYLAKKTANSTAASSSSVPTQRFLSEPSSEMRAAKALRQTSNPGFPKSKPSVSDPSTPQDRLDSQYSCPTKYSSRQDSANSLTSSVSTNSERDRTSSIDRSLLSRPSESIFFPPNLLPPERAEIAVQHLDKRREERLRERKVIGKPAEGVHRDINLRISVKKVNFKWQRGTKIGEGQFGVVYTAVNVNTGEMMAMKEIRFQPNDIQAIKCVADELKTFEGIIHPNLVKYYGIELHKEELFIFMEYCNEGTLEEMSKMGLTEPLIRRYTRELVVAVEFLHSKNIVHRDIKGANIFMVANDKLKLGDFGCSTKMKSHSTMPGEMMQFVGTAAYMAPEVITQKGHGRAADIWSLGCVVLEMVTGKRPWHELENYHQIMFKVGMGSIPVIPDTFHPEGQDFLFCCFEVDPNKRSTANELLAHLFIKV